MAKASDVKNGNILRFNGELIQVEEFIHRTPKALFGPAVKFLKEGMNVIVAFESEEPIMGSIPNSAELEITYTEPAVKGDTSSGAMKKATVETGAEINVPLFINIGDKVKVDTTSGTYTERVKA